MRITPASTLHAPSGRRSAIVGLTAAEASRRLQRDGPNEIPPRRATPAWWHLLRQFVHLFALMLWTAGGLALVAGIRELGFAIFAVVVVNAFFAFAQEYRAERAAEALRDLLPRRAIVIRDGVRADIDAADLVVGDVVVLVPGARVSADLTTLVADTLYTDNSSLTGESAPVPAGPGETLYASTFVTNGSGLGAVAAVGKNTRLAGIEELTRLTKRPTPPMARELKRVVRRISAIAVGVGITFFLISLALDQDPSTGFVLAIGVTVALVPEALLPTVTLSLAIGAQRLAHRNALVRRLDAVETLGSTTYICTDKTGTLTMNEMSVVEVWTESGTSLVSGAGYDPDGRVSGPPAAHGEVVALAGGAATCSDGRVDREGDRWVPVGDPMEAALFVFAARAGAPIGRSAVSRRFPFDAERRRSSVVLVGERVVVMGAADGLLELCREAGSARVAQEAMAGRGLRVVAVAAKQAATPPGSVSEAERDLTLLGLIGLEDPPRPEAREAIERCRRAGIKLAMLTGDHPGTASSIASQVGLAVGAPLVVCGDDLPDDEGELSALLDRDGIVLARVGPEQKLRIARAIRARGHVLAMTGDGVNDGPALQEADIGVAMGRSGTDVAREAADLVLLDDDFATIVAAVEEGRATFTNAKRFLMYHLTDNVAELTPFAVWALSGGRFPLALSVMQILALDLGTDTLSAVALGAEAPSGRALDDPPSRGRLLNALVARRAFGVMGPVEAAAAMAAFVVSLLFSGWRPGLPFPGGRALAAASGATFVSIVVAQTANAYASRSFVKPPWSIGWAKNHLLVVGSSIELVIAALFLFVHPLPDLLDHASPSLAGWLAAFAAAPLVLLVDALVKRRLRARIALGR